MNFFRSDEERRENISKREAQVKSLRESKNLRDREHHLNTERRHLLMEKYGVDKGLKGLKSFSKGIKKSVKSGKKAAKQADTDIFGNPIGNRKKKKSSSRWDLFK